MKILVTGMTGQQCGTGTRLDYEPVADLFVKALIAAGHAVWHRDISPGPVGEKTLDHFDVVFVGIVPPLSIASKHLHGALWTIAEAERRHLPLAFFLDDWAFPSLITKLGTCSRGPHHLVKPFFASRPNHEWAVAHLSELHAVIDRLLYLEWAPTVIPAFTWGDHSILGNRLPMAHQIEYVDPSSFARPYPITQPESRTRRWVLGTVSDQRGWLEKLQLTWPVWYIGSKSSKASESLKEPQLVQAYADNRGVLSPPYPRILGTGWWRNRFVYAASTRSILYCDPREAPFSQAYNVPDLRVEEMNDAELDEVADWQTTELHRRQMPSTFAACKMQDVIDAAIARVK